MIRSIFKPEEGKSWGAFDYSQQEPRLVVHLASLTAGGLRGADEFVNAYHDNPNTDFHTMVSEMAKIDRKKSKTINLGLFYGMGKGKFANLPLPVTSPCIASLILPPVVKRPGSAPFIT